MGQPVIDRFWPCDRACRKVDIQPVVEVCWKGDAKANERTTHNALESENQQNHKVQNRRMIHGSQDRCRENQVRHEKGVSLRKEYVEKRSMRVDLDFFFFLLEVLCATCAVILGAAFFCSSKLVCREVPQTLERYHEIGWRQQVP